MLVRLKLSIAKCFFYLLAYLPLPVLHAIGGFLGWLLYFIPTRLRFYAAKNIALCFPELSSQARKELLRAGLIETGKGFLEGPVFWLRSQQHLNNLIKEVDGLEAASCDFADKKSIIFLGCHMGAYYLANAYLAPRFPGITWIYKPQKGIIEALTQHLRDQFGARFVPTSREGVIAMRRNLQYHGAVGMSIDHNALDSGSIFAPFFNIKVPTMTLAARLAAKSKASVYFMFMQRLPKGRGYHFHVKRLADGIYSNDLLEAATTMNQALEEAIRFCPSQNEWLYRRFWDRPEGEPPLY